MSFSEEEEGKKKRGKKGGKKKKKKTAKGKGRGRKGEKGCESTLCAPESIRFRG